MTASRLVEFAAQLSDAELAAVIADLQAVQAARWATAHQTRVEHQTGAAG